MTPAAAAGWRSLERAVGALRRRIRVGAAGIGAALLTGAWLAAALLPARWTVRDGSPVPLLLAVLALAGIAVVLGQLRRQLERARPDRLGREIEDAVGLRDGELTGALELEGPGAGSPELRSWQRERVGRTLAAADRGDHAAAGLVPRSWAAWRRRARSAALGAGVLAGLLAVTAVVRPERTLGAGEALLVPWRIAFPPPPAPLHPQPGDTAIARGDSLPVRVTAAEAYPPVWLAWTSRPSGGARRPLVPLSAGARGAVTGTVEAPLSYWVETEGGVATSDTFTVTPVDPLLFLQLEVEVRLPTWMGREPERFAHPFPPLVVPPGTRIRVRGETNAPLEAAALSGPGGRIPLVVTGRRVEGSLAPERSGEWAWALNPRGAAAGVRRPRPLAVTVRPDRLPTVRIVRPGADAVFPAAGVLELLVDASDDIGLGSLELVAWRTGGTGRRGAQLATPLPLSAGTPARQLVRVALASERFAAAPGHRVLYFARVRDANPAHPPVTSDTFAARVPELGELRQGAAERGGALAREAAAAGERLATLGRRAREAARRAAAPVDAGGTDRSAPQRAEFAATEEARSALREGRSVAERLETLTEKAEALREDLAGSPLVDPRLEGQLERLRELLGELTRSGLADRLEELREALRQAERTSLAEALRGLEGDLETLRRRLEIATALMERVALEQSLRGAVEEAEELAAAAGRAAESSSPPPAEQAELGADAEALAGRLEELAERLATTGEDEVSDASRAAAGAFRTGSEVARRAPAVEATDRPELARRASAAMSEGAEQAGEAERKLREEWREAARRSVRRAATEALALAREQAAIGEQLEAGRNPASLQGRQAAVREGLDNLTGALAEAGRRTALLDRRSGPAAARAAAAMDSLAARMSAGAGSGSAAGIPGRAAESLNELAGALLASEEAIGGSASGTGVEEALERLAGAGRLQAGLHREGQGLLLLQAEGRDVGARLRRLAAEQAGVAGELRDAAEAAGAEGLPARPEALAAEADEIATRLRAGTLDPETVRRQERLFRRLLDAGRTLEKDEPDPRRRESRTATAVETAIPSPPPPEAVPGPRVPYPGAAELRGIPPGERRLILEYFDRVNRGPEGEGGS